MADAIMKRQVTALIGRCYAGLDVADLRDEVLRRLRRIVSVDAAFFGTVDPQTWVPQHGVPSSRWKAGLTCGDASAPGDGACH
jgi:hypothetical protein